MALLKKTLFDEKLETYNVLVEDTAPFSDYFKITELPDTFTGGKNAFLIQGSEELVADSVVKIQIKDSQGNIIYNEPGEGIPEYYEGTSKVISLYIYPDTSFGPCTITILGELKEYYSNGLKVPVPTNWQDTYNVRWQTQVNVNPLLQNTTKIRFYRRPKVDIVETILPIYNRTVNRVTISGSVDGIAINPEVGSNFKTFKGDTFYELKISGSNFSSSMEGETITITNLNQAYSTIIKDVVNSKKAIATIPYYETSSNSILASQIVTEFSSASFTLPYNESITLSNSTISSSFAKIKLTDLETFSGDVNRLKIYASRKADIGNYTLLEDIQLESNEILQKDEYSGSVNIRTGLFSSQNIINEFWVYKDYDSSTKYTATLNNTDLVSSVKIVDDGIQNTSDYPQRIFYYSSSLDLSKNTEYQLDFTPILSSSLYGNNIIEIYGSGSAFVNSDSNIGLGKNIGKLVTNSQFRRYDKQQVNFKTDADGTGTIVFAVYQGNWQLSNISLRATQETNFSPNELTLNVAVPTKVNNDAFDFKFEFYDINNNYVPITLEKEFTFSGGTDSVVRKSLLVVPSSNLFSFSGSGSPVGTTSITLDITKVGLTGSVTFISAAFDATGGYLSPSLYSGGTYPGLLSNVTDTSATLTVGNFTGSVNGIVVSRVLYTASCEDVSDFVNIYRIDQGSTGRDGREGVDGQNFIAIANKNQFVYDPDNHNVPAQLNDFIDIKLSSNIVSGSLTISSGSYLPRLDKISTNQIGFYTESIYRIYSGDDEHDVAMLGTNVASWSYNTPTNDIHKGTYIFTQNGFSASVQIEGVLKGEKSKNLNATSNANQFFYKMTDVSLSPSGQSITIDVKRNNLGSTTNTITVTSGSGKPALTVGSNNGTTGVQSYSINGSDYPYTAGDTKYTFTSEDLNFDSYNDSITITPVIAESQIAVNLSNENTTFPAYSGGTVFGGFLASSGSISVKVGSEDIVYASTIGNNKFSASISSSLNVTPVLTNNNYSITALSADSGSINLKVTYRDGRGTDSVFTKLVTYSKAKAGSPNVLAAVSPSAQSISANSKTSGSSTPTALTITALEAGTSRFTSIGTPTYTNGLTGSISSNVITITSTASNITGSNAQVTIPVNYTDSEGASGTKNVVATVSKALAAAPSVVVSIEKDGQTVTKNTSNSYGTPSSFKLYVAEGGSSYTYDGTPAYGNSTFRIVSVTNGTTSGTDGNTFASITPTTPSSTSGLLVSITGSYVDSEGTSTTFFKTHNVNVASDGTNGNTGATGPGIVLRGEYAAGTTYYYTTVAGSSRRDAVYQNSGGVTKYYATLQGTTGNAPTDGASNSYWEFLGTQDFFVAAKIAIFDESYVKNTLNVGTNASGSAANITLAGGTTKPFVSIGQGNQKYSCNGIFMGISGSNNIPVVSFVSGSNYLKFDAGAESIVDIGGKISATILTAQTGSIGGFQIQSNLLQGGSTTSGIELNGNNSTIIVGNLTSNASARVSPAGFYAGNTVFGSAPFSVDLNGALKANNADICGKITATGGTIGGWIINQNSISKDRITLNAGGTGAENYIQITGDPNDTYSGNRVFIHPGPLTSLSGTGGNVINATIASNYVNVSSAATICAGNTGTTATMGASGITMGTSLSSSSTFNIIAKLRFKIDVAYESVATTQVLGCTNTRSYTSVNNAGGQMAWSTLNETGYVNLTTARPDWGWIPMADTSAVSNFLTALYNATGNSYGSVQAMAEDLGSWSMVTALSYMNGSIGINSTMTYKTSSGGTTISTFSPSSQITSEELAEVTYNVNSTGNGTTGPSFAITKTNTLFSSYRQVIWKAGFFNFNFTGYGGGGTQYTGWAIYAEVDDNYISTPTSVVYSAKTTSLTANALTKQVEISEAGLQALFNATQSSAGNYFKISDVGTPSTSNFNIESAGYLAHYGEMHVKGDIAGFSTALSSDRRLKKDIVDIEDTEIEDMDKLHPVTYSWKDDKDDNKHYGFIAQDVQKIYPHLTKTKIMGEYLTINYNELIPVMVKQIQNLKKELEDVKKVLGNGK